MRISAANLVATSGLAIGFLLIAKDLTAPVMIAASFSLADRLAGSALLRRWLKGESHAAEIRARFGQGH